MSTNKKVILLKEISNGVFQNDGETKGIAKLIGENLTISLYSLPKAEYFCLYLSAGDLKTTPVKDSEITVDEKIKSLAVIKKQDNKTIPVAYGKFSADGESLEEILEFAQNPYQKTDQTTVENTVFQEEYDDEAVATYNYYEYESEVKDNADQTQRDGVYCDQNEDCRQKPQDGNFKSNEFNENDFSQEFGRENGGEAFFDKIKNDVEPLFKSYPQEERLMKMVKGSKWVKIAVENGKHYTVGIISQSGIPKYICYGLPSDYFSPPPEMQGYKSFIPISPFDLRGKGYWVMYQDVTSGCLL